jgi:hypothetical protein
MRSAYSFQRALMALGLVAVCVILSGCPQATIDRGNLDQPNPVAKVRPTPPILKAPVGFPVASSNYVVHLIPLKSRIDPFALNPTEQLYENQQMAAYFATTYSGWPLFYPGPPPPPPTPQIEPQPHRRLAGILIGDSVTALIDMGDGALREVHPGEEIAGTEWTVVSIDGEKAVLRRTIPGKLPNEVVVRLESGSNNGPPPSTGGPPPSTGGRGTPTNPRAPRGGLPAKFGGGAPRPGG